MIRVNGASRLRAEPEKSAVEQDRPAAEFLEHAACRAFDGGTIARERGHEIRLPRRRGDEMIFQCRGREVALSGRNGCTRRVVAAHEQYRATRRAQEAFRDTAEHRAPDAAPAMRAEYGQIDRMFGDIALQAFRNILTEVRFDDFRIAVHPGVRDRPLGVSQHRYAIVSDLLDQCIRVESSGVAEKNGFVDDENGKQTGLVQAGHLQAFVKCLSGRSTTVYGDHDIRVHTDLAGWTGVHATFGLFSIIGARRDRTLTEINGAKTDKMD
ncbi:hypothetical protein J2785_006302 [Burkholderia ambifaria]|nr:hypothetical protein [Burkholderia ambifaria]